MFQAPEELITKWVEYAISKHYSKQREMTQVRSSGGQGTEKHMSKQESAETWLPLPFIEGGYG